MTNAAKKLAGIAPGERVSFRFYPRQKNLFDAIGDLFGNPEVSARAVQGFVTLMSAAPVRAIVGAISDLPRGGVELRATNLPGSP